MKGDFIIFSCEKFLNTIVCYTNHCHFGAMPLDLPLSHFSTLICVMNMYVCITVACRNITFN